MLQELNKEEIEEALLYLHNQPMNFPPPARLKHLNEVEWFLLEKMLHGLLEEKEQHPLQ